MSRKIVILQGHPDPGGDRYCHALAAAYAEGARAAGHEVVVVDIARLDFPLLRTKAEFESGAVPAALVPVQQAVAAAGHLVIIYPLWLGAMPALLKGFLEQLLRPGFALGHSNEGEQRSGGLLRGKSARIVVTMGMPALAYRWFFGAHSLKSLERNILRFCGVAPVRETLIGMVEGVSAAKRERWLGVLRELGREGR